MMALDRSDANSIWAKFRSSFGAEGNLARKEPPEGEGLEIPVTRSSANLQDEFPSVILITAMGLRGKF